MDIEYVDILTRKNCGQFRLLIWTSFTVSFVNSAGEEGMGQRGMMGRIVILASYEYHYIRVHENVVQHPINNTSIALTNVKIQISVNGRQD